LTEIAKNYVMIFNVRKLAACGAGNLEFKERKMFGSGRSAALGLALSLGMFASAAQADVTVITFSTPATGHLLVASNGNGTLTVSTDALSGAAFSPLGNAGTWTMSALAPTLTGLEVGSIFSLAANSINWNFVAGADHVGGTISWTGIQDGTNQPRFLGTATVNSLGGQAAFTSLFANPSSGLADFTWNIFNITLSQLAGLPDGTLVGGDQACTGTNRCAVISSGEVVLPQVPLPGALPLFVTGMIGLWALGKRRKKQKVESAVA
jgi:hypothetical protein